MRTTTTISNPSLPQQGQKGRPPARRPRRPRLCRAVVLPSRWRRCCRACSRRWTQPSITFPSSPAVQPSTPLSPHTRMYHTHMCPSFPHREINTCICIHESIHPCIHTYFAHQERSMPERTAPAPHAAPAAPVARTRLPRSSFPARPSLPPRDRHLHARACKHTCACKQTSACMRTSLRTNACTCPCRFAYLPTYSPTRPPTQPSIHQSICLHISLSLPLSFSLSLSLYI